MTNDPRDARLMRMTAAFEVFCNAAPESAQVVAVVVSRDGTGLFGNVECDLMAADALRLGVRTLESDEVADATSQAVGRLQ